MPEADLDIAENVDRPSPCVALSRGRIRDDRACCFGVLDRFRNVVDVERRNLGWRMWWGGPWGATRLVTARKAA